MSERIFESIIEFYGRTLQWVLKHQFATLVVAAATLVLTVLLYIIVPKGFFPVQDTGIIQGISEAAQSISFPAMSQRQQQLVHNHPARSRRRECFLVHRHRRNQHDAE